jgi:hypothetical protein
MVMDHHKRKPENPISRTLCAKGPEIFQWGGRVLSKSEQIPPDWPADSREVHERLSRLAPILQTTKRQHPYFEGYSYPWEEPPEVREGYTHVEYWESEAGDKEGIWVFAVHEPGEPVDREEVEDYVWLRVKDQEKVVEDFLELPSGLGLFRKRSEDLSHPRWCRLSIWSGRIPSALRAMS